MESTDTHTRLTCSTTGFATRPRLQATPSFSSIHPLSLSLTLSISLCHNDLVWTWTRAFFDFPTESEPCSGNRGEFVSRKLGCLDLSVDEEALSYTAVNRSTNCVLSLSPSLSVCLCIAPPNSAELQNSSMNVARATNIENSEVFFVHFTFA